MLNSVKKRLRSYTHDFTPSVDLVSSELHHGFYYFGPTQWRTQDFEKGGGARNFRKFERNINQNLKSSHSKFVPYSPQKQVKSKKQRSSLKIRPIFSPKTGEEQKRKRSSLKIRPIFSPKIGEEQKKKKVFTQNSSHIFPQNRCRAKKKRSSLKIRPIFSPETGEEQKEKKRSSLKFRPIFCPVRPSPKY